MKLLKNLREFKRRIAAPPIFPIKIPTERIDSFEQKCKLSLCLIARNEGEYLIEFIEFHRKQGVEHFFVYDNNSTDNTKDICDFYVSQKICTYLPFETWDYRYNPQILAYAHYLATFRTYSEWTIFIDADEFLFSPIYERLTDLVDRHKDKDAILVPWRMFGTDGHISKPKSLVTRSYYQVAYPDTDYSKFKSIVRATKVTAVPSRCPHLFQFEDLVGGSLPNGKLLNFNNNKYVVQLSDVSPTELYLNHYFTKSKQEFELKLKNRRAVAADPNSLTELKNRYDRGRSMYFKIHRHTFHCDKINGAFDGIEQKVNDVKKVLKIF